MIKPKPQKRSTYKDNRLLGFTNAKPKAVELSIRYVHESPVKNQSVDIAFDYLFTRYFKSTQQEKCL